MDRALSHSSTRFSLLDSKNPFDSLSNGSSRGVKLRRIGLGLDCKLPYKNLLSIASRAESEGFGALWAIHYHFYRDPFSILAAIASSTTRVLLGTAVTNPFEKHPISVAMSAATIKEILGENRSMILGLGRGVEHILRNQMGIRYDPSIRALDESVRAIKDFLVGREVNFKGKFFEMSGISSGIPSTNLPVYLAAMGERALSLAGRVADGVVLNYCTNPEYILHAIARIKSARPSKNLDNFAVTSLLWVMPEETEASIQFAKRTIADLLSFPGFGEMLIPFIGETQDFIDSIRKCYCLPEKRTDLESAARQITEPLIRSVVIVGRRAMRRRLEEYYNAGLEHSILVPMGEDIQLEKTIEEYSGQFS